MSSENRMVLDFSKPNAHMFWRIINDGVMGGISKSEISFTENDSAVFQGTLSLENNGGFASVRQSDASYDLAGYGGLILQVRGDGRPYQLRVRTDSRFDGISYRYRFTTQPDVILKISAPFADFEPVSRGRVVPDAPPLEAAKIEQIGFLIADKHAGPFRLEIYWLRAF